MKKYLPSLLITILLLIFVKAVLAYDLTLTGVGQISTLGVNYSVVNYTGGIPILTGTASPSAKVGIKIKTLLNYTTASTSGIWQFVPASLDQGDNQLVISSGVQSIIFNLRFNATGSASLSATPVIVPDTVELPASGVWWYYVPIISFSIGVIFLGGFTKKKMQKWENGD